MGCNQGKDSPLAKAQPNCCVPFVVPGDFKNEGIKIDLQPHQESGRPSLGIGSNTTRIDQVYDFAGSKPVGDLGGWSCTAVKKGSQTVRTVKYVARAEVDNKDSLESWKDHIKNIKALNHPSISKLYETLEDFRFVYFVSDHCVGQLLLDGILTQQKNGAFSEQLVAGLMKQIVEACRHLHSHRLCHRNLQPECFRFLELLGKKGSSIADATLKLVDFQLVIPFKDKSPISDNTPLASYIAAPEVKWPPTDPQKYNEKVDVWACGVLAYILLSGCLPFGGGSELQIYSRLRRAKEEPCRCEGPNWGRISETAKAFVDAVLRVDTTSRPSAEEVLSKNEWLRGQARGSVFEPMYFSSLQRLNSELRVNRSLLSAVALYASDSHIRLLEASLSNEDKNGDQIITVNQLKHGVFATKIQLPASLVNMLSDMEADHSESRSVVTPKAFIAAVRHLKRLEEERICWHGFRIFDVTDTGMCPKDDLQIAVASPAVERMMKGQHKELVKKLTMPRPNRTGALKMSFKTSEGKMEQVTFTRVPLGLDFENSTPLTIKTVDLKSHAGELGVRTGWVVQSVGDVTIQQLDIESARELVMRKVFEIEGIPHGPPPGPEANMSFDDFMQMIREAQQQKATLALEN